MERMSYPTYSDLELEIQQLEEENKKLELQIAELMWERDWKQMKIDRLEERIKEHVPTQILADFRNRFKD